MQWLTTPRPSNEQCAPPGILDGFKKLLSTYKDSKIILGKATLLSDLTILSSNNWVNIGIIQGFIELINANSYNAKTAAFILNDLIPLSKMDKKVDVYHSVGLTDQKHCAHCTYDYGHTRCHTQEPGSVPLDTAISRYSSKQVVLLFALGWAPPNYLKSTIDFILERLFTVFLKTSPGVILLHTNKRTTAVVSTNALRSVSRTSLYNPAVPHVQ